MKLEDLYSLKKLCNSSINYYTNNYYLKILPAFNLVNEHPININRFRNFLEGKKFSIFLYLIGSFFVYFYKTICNFFQKSYSPKDFFSLFEKQYDNIFVSHLVNQDLKLNEDFYFKDLPLISSKRKKTLLILIDHNNLYSKFTKRDFKKKYTTLILSNNLPIKIKLLIFAITAKVFFTLLKDIFFSKNNKTLLLNALANIYRDNTQVTYKLSYQFNLILNEFKPKKIFYTYEGYSWEKSLLILARKKNDIETIGFQHSRIFSKINLNNEFIKKETEPDIILTTGEKSFEEFSKNKIYSKIINIGKPKKKAAIINNEDKNKNKTICVLPEGIDTECYHLLSFVFKSAKKYNDLNFICRFHPLTDLVKLRKKMKLNRNLPKNIKISESKLENDLENSNYALYRGSSSVLLAMKNGLIPIYLSLEDEIDISITNNNYDWHLKVKKPEKLYSKINETYNKQFIKDNRKKIIKFYNEYYSNFNYSNFIKII